MSPEIGTGVYSCVRFLAVANRAKRNTRLGWRAGVQSPGGTPDEEKIGD